MWNKLMLKRREKKEHGQMSKILTESYTNRFWITVFTLVTFTLILVGVGMGLLNETPVTQEWKEILLLLLGAFIGWIGKVIDFWFNNEDNDREIMKNVAREADYIHGVSNDRREIAREGSAADRKTTKQENKS